MIDKLLYFHIFSYWSAVLHAKYDQWSVNLQKMKLFESGGVFNVYIIPYHCPLCYRHIMVWYYAILTDMSSLFSLRQVV